MQSVAIDGERWLSVRDATGGDVKNCAARSHPPETHIVSTSIGAPRGL